MRIDNVMEADEEVISATALAEIVGVVSAGSDGHVKLPLADPLSPALFLA
jgi:hypothetical protein